MVMQNRISDAGERLDSRPDEPQSVGAILEELLAQYERQFPDVHSTVAEPATAAVQASFVRRPLRPFRTCSLDSNVR
jgi:hypothetical protein